MSPSDLLFATLLLSAPVGTPEQVPPPERGRLLFHKIMADVSARTPWGIWLGLVIAVGTCVTPAGKQRKRP